MLLTFWSPQLSWGGEHLGDVEAEAVEGAYRGPVSQTRREEVGRRWTPGPGPRPHGGLRLGLSQKHAELCDGELVRTCGACQASAWFTVRSSRLPHVWRPVCALRKPTSGSEA